MDGRRGVLSRFKARLAPPKALPFLHSSATIFSMSTVSVSLPDALAARLAGEARRRSTTPDALVQQSLEKTLPSEESAAATSFLSAAGSSIGMFEGPVDLSTNPRYLDDFGK
jgi:hypothetical protein